MQLTLYYREGCHLCDDMRREVYQFIEQFSKELVLHEIDIDRDSTLIEKFHEKVPVLCLDGQLISCYFFEKQLLVEALSEM